MQVLINRPKEYSISVSTLTVTRIDASIVVAYDGASHVILRDGVVVYEGNRIIHVGKSYSGRVDEARKLYHLVLEQNGPGSQWGTIARNELEALGPEKPPAPSPQTQNQ